VRKKGSAEGRSPFAGGLGESVKYKIFPLPGQSLPKERGSTGWAKGFSISLLVYYFPYCQE
jgi:hypothetical protein